MLGVSVYLRVVWPSAGETMVIEQFLRNARSRTNAATPHIRVGNSRGRLGLPTGVASQFGLPAPEEPTQAALSEKASHLATARARASASSCFVKLLPPRAVLLG